MSSSIPKVMSGLVIEKAGGPDALVWKEDLPVPELQESEVLVRNEYVDVNYIDTYYRSGLYQTALPLVTGYEGAGVVVAVHPSLANDSSGSGKIGIQVKDRVTYISNHAYAEYTAVPAHNIIHLPNDISTETAAASLLQGLTALTLVKESAGLKPQLGLAEDDGTDAKWVLVHAAAGGTGSLLVQVLTSMGIRVIGTASSPEKQAVARENGAQWVLHSREGDLVAQVKEITGGHGPDIIFDGVGQATFEQDLQMIARKGNLVMFGNSSGKVPAVELTKLGAKNIKLMRPMLFNYIDDRDELNFYANDLFEQLRAEKIRIAHAVYPMKEASKAHTDLEGRKTTGKLLLKV